MDDQKVSDQYKKWFNRGYHLRSTMPDIFKNMIIPPGEPKEITKAFEDGRKQFEKEHNLNIEKDNFRERMSEQIRIKSKDQSRER